MMSCHPERSAQRGVEGSRAASASALFDLHCHLDFDPDVRVAAQELAELDMGAFSTTVTPEGYEWACELLEPFGNVRVGLGLHPWWIADGRLGSQDVALFERLAKDERFIGEVGLDTHVHCPFLSIIAEVGLDTVLEVHDTLRVDLARSP